MAATLGLVVMKAVLEQGVPHISLSIQGFTYVCTYIYIYVQIHMCIDVQINIYIHIYIYTSVDIHTYVHIYIYRYTDMKTAFGRGLQLWLLQESQSAVTRPPVTSTAPCLVSSLARSRFASAA